MTELTTLVQRIYMDAGFHVYVHAGGRPDLNDIGRGNENYVRAAHNYRGYHQATGYQIDSAQIDCIGGVPGYQTDFDVVAHGFLQEIDGSKVGISDLVNVDTPGMPYFVRLTIRAEIRDAANRISPGYPSLTVLADKRLCEDILRYLELNPERYMDFIKQVLPSDKFPKVNKGIIEKAVPSDVIIFLDAGTIDKTQKTRGENYRLENWVYDAYGKRVNVRK